MLKKLMPFDAVMLGMGEDGHIASLIPGSPVMAHAMDPAGAALTAESPQGFGVAAGGADHADPRGPVAKPRHLPLDRRRG